MAFQPIVRAPVYLQVADQLRDAILSGELAAGEALPPERDLAETFGASRASVREALRVLQAQGLISGSGTPAPAVVAEGTEPSAREALITLLRLNRVELEQLVDFRCMLESAALRRAADAPDADRLDDARRALEEMAAPDLAIEAFDEADVRFHVALVRASGNEAMHLVMAALRDAVARHLLAALRAQADPRRTLARLTAEHAAILDAVESGQAERAAGLVEAHIRGFYAELGDEVGPG
jgi:GntR family transcriptional repressor for pyruvate dehydrogenase complex